MKSTQQILELLLANQHIKYAKIEIIQELSTKTVDTYNIPKDDIIDDETRWIFNKILGIH